MPIQSVMLFSCLVFITVCTQSDRPQQFSIVFGVEHTCTIDHVVVPSGFHHRPHPVRQVLTVQFQFRCRPDLYDRSRRCLIWFSSQTIRDPIIHDNSFRFQHRLHLYDKSHRCPIQFLSQSTLDSISHYNLVSFSMQIAPVRQVTSLSYLLFIIGYTRSNRSQQFSIIFNIEHTCTIGHVVTLSGFHHKPHPIK